MATVTEDRRSETSVANGQAVSPQDKFARFRKVLNAGLIERQEEVSIILTAVLMREHPLFVGNPGTGKSMMCDSLLEWINGEGFSILLNKFTTPEEVFGPVSVKGLKDDKYKRITDGFLPTADIFFADEIFKASSAILNTMLKILNERTYRNGNGETPVPLQIAVAASNEWPQEQNELGALFDRFLFRRKVETIRSSKGQSRLLWDDDLGPKIVETITVAEIEDARDEAGRLKYTQDAKDAFESIVAQVRGEGIFPGDRRLRKSVMACKAYAYLDGAVVVDKVHLGILAHTLWEDPAEQPRKVSEIVGKIANPAGMKVMELMAQVDAAVGGLDETDIGALTTCHQKLKAIRDEFDKLPSGGNASHGIAHCEDEMKRVKMAVAKLMT